MADIAAPDRIESIGPEFFADPHACYRRWREDGPVRRVLFPDGVIRWVVLGLAEARAALADPTLHKDAVRTDELVTAKRDAPPSDPRALALLSNMLNTDPPEHTRLRKLVSKAFTMRRMAALRPRIEAITSDLLDAMADREEVDLLRDFAVPLPITVICELLGVPVSDRDAFQEWTKALVGVVGLEHERARATAAMAAFLTTLVATKRGHPGDDLLSALITPADDGDTLTAPELVSMSFLLLVAGHETTVNLIANGTLALLTNPPRLAALRADLAEVPAAVEEFLRYDGPVNMSTPRFTTVPTLIGETLIPPNELLYIALSAANRDPNRYPTPDTLDPDRDTAGHLAFGHGIHFCLGAPLARLEADIAFTAVLQRFPDLRLAPVADPAAWQTSTLIRGLHTLPVLVHPPTDSAVSQQR
ncbi:cytochrome P450 [Nocardia sp. NBC_00511]|uniref:cytochrome P450 family protein n=1 Tax=Nocardia sp. NBC_00511 TaxID=2903591 RepID=UPI0030E1E0AF